MATDGLRCEQGGSRSSAMTTLRDFAAALLSKGVLRAGWNSALTGRASEGRGRAQLISALCNLWGARGVLGV